MNAKLVKISKDSYTWLNATRNVKVTPLRFFYPRNKEDIAEIILDAEAKDLRVRAVGSGHSYSEAPKGKVTKVVDSPGRMSTRARASVDFAEPLGPLTRTPPMAGLIAAKISAFLKDV